MQDRLGMATQFAANSLRMSWYSGINWLAGRQTRRAMEGVAPFTPTMPVPSRDELLSDVRKLLARDAIAVRDGLFPPSEGDGVSLAAHLGRLREMFRDLPGSAGRRASRDASTARELAEGEDLPEYFTQDFHFQTGGYLSEDSARLYDLQVETLFYGAAGVMRRAGLRPIADYMRGRDQRQMSLLDVACGTGRFLRDIRLAFPALGLSGLDLSRTYLEEGRTCMRRLRPAEFIAANAEEIPFADQSQDIVTCVFLFHELPGEVRRRVSAEIARVLKPGGLFVFIDSLQMGDRPGWDGLLEAFPVRFHEPYFRHYAIDDLEGVFSNAGLEQVSTEHAFLSKVMARRKTGQV